MSYRPVPYKVHFSPFLYSFELFAALGRRFIPVSPSFLLPRCKMVCVQDTSLVTDVGLGTLQVFLQVLLSSGSPPEGVSSPSSFWQCSLWLLRYFLCLYLHYTRGGVAAHPSPLVTLLLCYKYSMKQQELYGSEESRTRNQEN